MGGKFDVPAQKICWPAMRDGLYLLGLRCWLADWRSMMLRTSSGVRCRDGNGSVGHGSWVKWVTILDGSRSASDPLTHDEITLQ